MKRPAVAKTAFALLFVCSAIPPTAAPGQSQPRLSDRPAGVLPLPEGVKAYRNLAYVENGHNRQKLDLYVPETAEPLPVLLWVHGGGWQSGSKDGCPPLRAGYPGLGYAVASIGYRLSGDAMFPAQIEDCKAAIRWLRAHAGEYHFDPNRFGVWGSSAGGHLVAMLGTSGDVQEFDVGSHLDQTSRVQAVCDYYGPTDFTVFVTTPGYEHHAKADAPEGKLIGGAVLEKKDKAARANPIRYVTEDDPGFLIVHGDADRTVPLNQSELLFEALQNAGTSVHFHTIHGAGHGGSAFNDPAIGDMVRKFFEATLKTGRVEPGATKTESTAVEPNPDRRVSDQRPSGSANRGISWQTVVSRQDNDKDGKISKDEFRGPPRLFARLDGDNDGYVTEKEHEAAFPGRAEDR